MTNFVARLIALIGLLGVLSFSAPVFAQDRAQCTVGYGCLRCQGGRAYARVGTFCGVCWQFCVPLRGVPELAGLSDEEANRVRLVLANLQIDPRERLLFINTPDSMILQVALANPDAAEMLRVMNIRSAMSPNSMPSVGDGTSDSLVSLEAIRLALTPGVASTAWESLLTKLSPDELSLVTWHVKETKAEATLTLKHRIVDSEGVELRTMHPDIAVKLVAAKAGKRNGRYWTPISWKALDR